MHEDARAERAILSSAEAYRLVNEAREQRERAELAETERDHWRALAEQYILERDAFRRTLADLIGIHAAAIVAPVKSDDR
jgi:hypothetical protein